MTNLQITDGPLWHAALRITWTSGWVHMDVQQTPTTRDIAKAIAAFEKDAARRTRAWDDQFAEMQKALQLLSAHPRLKDDTAFQGHLDGLQGIEDMVVFSDRVIALQAYVTQIAAAHGVVVAPTDPTGATNVLQHHKPDHLASLDEELAARTRLTMR